MAKKQNRQRRRAAKFAGAHYDFSDGEIVTIPGLRFDHAYEYGIAPYCAPGQETKLRIDLSQSLGRIAAEMSRAVEREILDKMANQERKP